MSLPHNSATKQWVIDLWNAADSPFDTQGHRAYEAAFSYTYPDGEQGIILEVGTGRGKTEQVRLRVSDLEALRPVAADAPEEKETPKRRTKR